MANVIKHENAFLSKLFDNLNEQFFEGSLPSVVLTVQGEKAGSKNTFGWFWANKWGEGLHEINITAENFKRPIFSVLVTMLHEMIHLQNNIKGVKDTSRQGRFHNKRFAEACFNHGLIAVSDEQIGYTTPHEIENQSKDLQAFFETMKANDQFKEAEEKLFQIARLKPISKPKANKKPSKWIELTCLSCAEDFQILRDKIEKHASFFCPYCNEMHTIENEEGEGKEEGEQ